MYGLRKYSRFLFFHVTVHFSQQCLLKSLSYPHVYILVSFVVDCVLSHFSCVHLFVTLWTAAHQAPLSMRFFRQDYWSGLPFPTPGDLPNPGMEPTNILKRERELSWSQTEHRNWWRSSRVDFLSQFWLFSDSGRTSSWATKGSNWIIFPQRVGSLCSFISVSNANLGRAAKIYTLVTESH